MAEYRWLIFALLSAAAAALVGIFGKMGMQEVNSNLATTIRSVVMTLFLVIVCSSLQLWRHLPSVSSKAIWAIILSGVAGALSWLFYFKAIQLSTVSRIAPIDKLSMPLAVVLAVLILGDRPSVLNWIGILIIALGAFLAGLPAK